VYESLSPQLLFAAALAASINKEQQRRVAIGLDTKPQLHTRARARALKGWACLLMLAPQSPTFNVLATLTFWSVLYW